ncbi:hypothetical protein ACFQE0_21015 [Methylobacterium komagatae]|uniref:Uncharacterized protein n=1 Tax=Methylobacterium komagatae TaxID=374425 RepID=A0ABW2BN20_9HYPH
MVGDILSRHVVPKVEPVTRMDVIGREDRLHLISACPKKPTMSTVPADPKPDRHGFFARQETGGSHLGRFRSESSHGVGNSSKHA